MGVTNFQKRNSFYLKIIALLSTVRWKNILVTVFAQYLAFLFAFNTKDDLWNSLVETKVHLIIAATAFILAGGYIINNFYDLEKDIINRPHRTRFQNLISDGFSVVHGDVHDEKDTIVLGTPKEYFDNTQFLF